MRVYVCVCVITVCTCVPVFNRCSRSHSVRAAHAPMLRPRAVCLTEGVAMDLHVVPASRPKTSGWGGVGFGADSPPPYQH